MKTGRRRLIVRCRSGNLFDVLTDASGATVTFATKREAAAEAARLNAAPSASFEYWAEPEYDDDPLMFRSLPRGEDR